MSIFFRTFTMIIDFIMHVQNVSFRAELFSWDAVSFIFAKYHRYKKETELKYFADVLLNSM
jgi:hypothetical protein